MAKLRTLAPRLAQARQTRAAFQDTAGGANASFYSSGPFRKWAAIVKARDGFRCVKCGATGRDAQLVADHICEIVDGGAPLDPANGQTLCAPCHNAKTAAARLARLGR